MARRKRYICRECGRPIVPSGGGYWRHLRKPRDGHSPSPNEYQRENIEALKLTGEIVTAATNPALYATLKTGELAIKAIKELRKKA